MGIYFEWTYIIYLIIFLPIISGLTYKFGKLSIRPEFIEIKTSLARVALAVATIAVAIAVAITASLSNKVKAFTKPIDLMDLIPLIGNDNTISSIYIVCLLILILLSGSYLKDIVLKANPIYHLILLHPEGRKLLKER